MDVRSIRERLRLMFDDLSYRIPFTPFAPDSSYAKKQQFCAPVHRRLVTVRIPGAFQVHSSNFCTLWYSLSMENGAGRVTATFFGAGVICCTGGLRP